MQQPRSDLDLGEINGEQDHGSCSSKMIEPEGMYGRKWLYSSAVATRSQAKPSQAKPSQAKPSQAKQIEAK